MYQRKVDVDMLNAVKSVLADVSSISPSSEQRHALGGLGSVTPIFDDILIYGAGETEAETIIR